jgi:4-amino-4-deoxy-L-arabinose transferase-like glycosyltransferase
VHPATAPARPLAIAAALGLAMAASLLLRTGALDAGYWIDEGIAIGIASHDLADIPGALRQDGSPPLYYLLLHGWMALAGTGEAATRSLSLLFALVSVPVAFWAGAALFDRRAGVLAAAGMAGCPFLTYYAQETRMYSLVVLLSLLASASFALAFLHGRRRHLALLVLWTTLLLYTHAWGLFLAVGMGVAWLLLWRQGRVPWRDGALAAGAVALLFAPWLPTLLFQASHTAAPWAERPSALLLLAIPGGLFGYLALPLLAVAVAGGLRRSGPPAGALRVLLVIAAAAAVAAWLGSQVQPAWSTRYLAVLLGPLLLALAAAVARAPRWGAVALAGVAVVWLLSGPPPQKSNARAVASAVAPQLRAGDLVVSTQPEQVPVLYRYLPEGLVYATPLGVAADPGVTDWREGMRRLRAGTAERRLLPVVAGLAPGRRVLLVTPVAVKRRSTAPWARAVRARSREWRAALRGHPRLRPLGAPRLRLRPGLRTAIRAQLYEVRAPAARR